MGDADTSWFNYRFKFPDGAEVVFEVVLDAKTGKTVVPQAESLPEWTLLENHKCSHCPLDSSQHQYCPAAVSVLDIVEYFHSVSSLQLVEVLVTSQERQIQREGVSLSTAISALMGARFAGSGCPLTEKFQPMVRHHLPFSSYEEAAYRVVSMYALAQLLRIKEGLEPDWELTGLSQMCQDANHLNVDFCRRLHGLAVNDSTMNGLSGLDCLIQMVDITMEDSLLEEMKTLFRTHLQS